MDETAMNMLKLAEGKREHLFEDQNSGEMCREELKGN